MTIEEAIDYVRAALADHGDPNPADIVIEAYWKWRNLANEQGAEIDRLRGGN